MIIGNSPSRELAAAAVTGSVLYLFGTGLWICEIEATTIENRSLR